MGKILNTSNTIITIIGTLIVIGGYFFGTDYIKNYMDINIDTTTSAIEKNITEISSKQILLYENSFSFPKISYYQREQKYIEALNIDDMNIVHAIVAHKYSYQTSSSYNTDNIVSRGAYYYITYDVNNKKISTTIKIADIESINVNGISSLTFKDFILFDNRPFLLFHSIDNNYYMTYKKNSIFVPFSTILDDAYIMWSEMTFFEYNNKLYTKWVDTTLGTTSEFRLNKFKEVYPSNIKSSNFSDIYLGNTIRVHNNILYASCGKIYEIDENLNILSTLYDDEINSCTVEGYFKSYNNSILESLPTWDNHGKLKFIKDDFTSFVVNSFVQASNSVVFDDEIISIGYNSSTYSPSGKPTNKITKYNLKTKKVIEFYIGNSPDSSFNYKKVAINKNKITVLGTLKNDSFILIINLNNINI